VRRAARRRARDQEPLIEDILDTDLQDPGRDPDMNIPVNGSVTSVCGARTPVGNNNASNQAHTQETKGSSVTTPQPPSEEHLLDPAILGSVIDWDAVDRALEVLEIQSQSHRTSKMVIQFCCLTHKWKEEVRRLRGSTGWLPLFGRARIIEFVSDEDCRMCGWKYDHRLPVR
jgi:hypothetical protein